MNFLSPLLMSLSSNIDTLAVATSYGLKKVRITKPSILLISTITSLGTLISMLIGKFISHLFSFKISNILGSVLLMLVGVYFLIQYIKEIKKNSKQYISNSVHNSSTYNNVLQDPTIIDSNNSGDIDIKESFILSFALTINNLGVGVAASITGVNIFLSVLFNFIVTILSIHLGNYIGKTFLSDLLGKYGNLVSGILLIILGLYETFI